MAQIDICNRALGRIRAGTIADLAEQSLSAQQCSVYYPAVISTMLERNDWSFANRRLQMAVAGTNDRPYEWMYAYNMPSDCAAPIQVLPDLNSLGVFIPVPIPGQPYAETWATLNGYAMPYVIENQTLYCNGQNAWLDYTINDITGVAIPELCARAIEIELASLLAVPVKGDSNREKELLPMVEIAWQQAIAADRNRQPTDWGNYISEAMAVRHSGAIALPNGQDFL